MASLRIPMPSRRGGGRERRKKERGLFAQNAFSIDRMNG
jgi:hypothetical protein